MVTYQAEMKAQQAAQQAVADTQQAEADSLIKILLMEREEAAALARLRALEQAMRESANSDSSILAELQDPVKCTSEYVLKHNVYNDTVISCTSY